MKNIERIITGVLVTGIIYVGLQKIDKMKGEITNLKYHLDVKESVLITSRKLNAAYRSGDIKVNEKENI